MMHNDVSHRVSLDIEVVGHDESEGCTYYELHCSYICHLGVNNSSGRSAWISHRRLAQLREDLYTLIKASLTDEDYRKYFGSTPFARHGGVPGTTARLEAWCRALARAVSTGFLPHEEVTQILRALGAPVEDPLGALSRAQQVNAEDSCNISESTTDSKGNDHEGLMDCIFSGEEVTESMSQPTDTHDNEMLVISNMSAEATTPCSNASDLHRLQNPPAISETSIDAGELIPDNQDTATMVAQPSVAEKTSGEHDTPHALFQQLVAESTEPVFGTSEVANIVAAPSVIQKMPDEDDAPLALPQASVSEFMNAEFCNDDTDQVLTNNSFEFYSPVSSPRESPSTPADVSHEVQLPAELSIFGPFESFPHGEPAIPHSPSFWTPGNTGAFRVRNVGYSSSGEKIASEFPLYDAVAADAIRSNSIISGIADRLPQGCHLPASQPGCPTWSPVWGVPRVLVINAQIPSKSGSLMGKHPMDDVGFSLVSYHVLSAQASELLSRDEWTPALRLWKRFVETGVSTKEGVTFKAIGHVANLEELSVPRIVHQFNAKPVVVTKSASVLTRSLPEAMEIDFDVRQWAYLARKSLVSLGGMAKNAVVRIGYLVEGKSDDELPEQILAQFVMHYADMERVKDVSHLLEIGFAPPSRVP